MTIVAGTVDRTSINATTGVASSSSGASGSLYTWLVAYYAGYGIPAALPTIGSTANPFSAARPCNAGDITHLANGRLAQFQQWADWANLGGQVLAHLVANGHAHVSVEQLGRIPTSIVTGQPIDAPSSPVDIPIQ